MSEESKIPMLFWSGNILTVYPEFHPVEKAVVDLDIGFETHTHTYTEVDSRLTIDGGV